MYLYQKYCESRPLPLKNGAGAEAYCIRVCPSESQLVYASRKTCEHHILKINEGNFTQVWSQVYLGS